MKFNEEKMNNSLKAQLALLSISTGNSTTPGMIKRLQATLQPRHILGKGKEVINENIKQMEIKLATQCVLTRKHTGIQSVVNYKIIQSKHCKGNK